MLSKKFTKIFLILFFALLFSVIIIFSFRQDEKIEVYGIRYGDSFYHSKHIYYEDILNKKIPFTWMFYVVKYQEKIILIDTGFRDESFIKSFGIDYRNPFELLQKLKINPDKVTDVILTHSHFDHIGNVDKFPNAKIYIQKKEWEHFREGTRSREIFSFLKNNKNLVLFNDYYKLYDFFEIKKIGGHTIGSSIVTFNYRNREYIFTGDECYLLDNCKGNPIGTSYDIEKNKRFIEEIKNAGNKTILPFHDIDIFNRYPTIKEFIVKII